MSLFSAVSLDWQTIFAHTKCYGDFQVRLSLTALSPLVLLALVFLIALGLSAWRTRRGGVRRASKETRSSSLVRRARLGRARLWSLERSNYTPSWLLRLARLGPASLRNPSGR